MPTPSLTVELSARKLFSSTDTPYKFAFCIREAVNEHNITSWLLHERLVPFCCTLYARWRSRVRSPALLYVSSPRRALHARKQKFKDPPSTGTQILLLYSYHDSNASSIEPEPSLSGLEDVARRLHSHPESLSINYRTNASKKPAKSSKQPISAA